MKGNLKLMRATCQVQKNNTCIKEHTNLKGDTEVQL